MYSVPTIRGIFIYFWTIKKVIKYCQNQKSKSFDGEDEIEVKLDSVEVVQS